MSRTVTPRTRPYRTVTTPMEGERPGPLVTARRPPTSVFPIEPAPSGERVGSGVRIPALEDGPDAADEEGHGSVGLGFHPTRHPATDRMGGPDGDPNTRGTAP